jgi:hypothetical protein
MFEDTSKLCAIIKIYENHHASCCVISPELRKSLDQELLDLQSITPPDRIELQSSQNHGNTSTLGLQFVTETGSSDLATKKRKRCGPRKDRPAWKTAAYLFVAEAPFTQDWNTRVEGLLQKSRSSSEPAERQFESTQEPEESAVHRARYHVRKAASFVGEASRSQAIGRVYLLCALSYLCVLESWNLIEEKAICDLMTEIAPEGSGEYKKRIRNGARQLSTKLMSGLVKAGWTWSQVTTLFIFC